MFKEEVLKELLIFENKINGFEGYQSPGTQAWPL